MGANNNYHNYEQKQPQQNAGKTSFKIFQSVLQEMTNDILVFFSQGRNHSHNKIYCKHCQLINGPI